MLQAFSPVRHERARRLALVLVLAAALCAVGFPRRSAARERMAGAARSFLAALEPAQREKAALAFESEERKNWHYIPRERKGLALSEMTDAQRIAAHSLLRSALSAQGYLKVNGVLELEGVLREIEGRPGEPAQGRDPGRYFVTVFGTPDEGPWGWRFEGHHVSLNFCSVTNAFTATTPFFLGANPATVPSGPDAGLRVLALEEDLGRELFTSLTSEQRADATLPGDVPSDVILSPGRASSFEKPAGLLVEHMSGEQLTLFMRLLGEIVDNLEAGLAEREWQRLHRKGIEKIRFAWCGSSKPREPHYWRLHGPHFVVEYDNVQGSANHVHVLWRDLENDFGGDMLRRHYEESHSKK